MSRRKRPSVIQSTASAKNDDESFDDDKNDEMSGAKRTRSRKGAPKRFIQSTVVSNKANETVTSTPLDCEKRAVEEDQTDGAPTRPKRQCQEKCSKITDDESLNSEDDYDDVTDEDFKPTGIKMHFVFFI